MNLKNLSISPRHIAAPGALMLALLALCFVAFPTDARAKSQCDNSGKCCDELNAFWKDKVYHLKESEFLGPHPVSKDFVVADSSKYPWPEKIPCPSIYGRFAGGLKFLYDTSHSSSSTYNYYEFVREAMLEAKYIFVFVELKGRFAEASGAMMAVVFSALNIKRESTPATAATIVHEAMHIEGAEHVICDHGQKVGKTSCDEHFDQEFSESIGSYSAQILFLHDVVRTGASAHVVEQAKSMMRLFMKNQINTLPEYGPDGVTPLMRYYGLE